MRTSAAALLLVLALSAPAFAQPGDRGNRGGQGDHRDHDADVVDIISDVVFGANAEAEIRSYFEIHPYTPEGLPPGIARNLERGKPLPPGIAKRYPPADLLALLPAYPGHEVIIVDDDILLVSIATQVIVDVLSGVL